MKDERIDNYVMGRMSDEELFSFEQELLNNSELQQEVALHQELVLAIQMKGAKAYARKKRSSRHHRMLIWRISTSFAVAACLLVGIFVNASLTNQCKRIGAGMELPEFGVRGGSSLDVISQKIQNNELKEALSLIEEEQSIQYLISDPDAIAQYNAEQQVLEWYKAVSYMRMGKWIKAKKLLNQIAASDSFYKAQAQEVLDRL